MIISFLWIPKEEMTPLVYLMTVIHSLHAGNIEKAVKYSDKCLSHIDRVKTTRLEKPIFIGHLA